MVDVKTCLDNAQEKMDMAIMYLDRNHASVRIYADTVQQSGTRFSGADMCQRFFQIIGKSLIKKMSMLLQVNKK